MPTWSGDLSDLTNSVEWLSSTSSSNWSYSPQRVVFTTLPAETQPLHHEGGEQPTMPNTTYYTEHCGWSSIYRHSTLAPSRIDIEVPLRESRGFNNPDDPATLRAAMVMAQSDYADHGEVRPLAYAAHHLRLPSTAAARDALRSAMERYGSTMTRWVRSTIENRFDEDDADEWCEAECCYHDPVDPSDDGEHSSWCECYGCSRCECGDPDCGDCYPDGYECGCYDRDCGYCYPNGYECGCGDEECPDCQHDDSDHDDLGADDDWEGRDAMPRIAPGRCRFGIEIEFNGHGEGLRNEMIPILQRNGFAVMNLGYTHEVTRCWKMTTDSTVSGGELVSPVLPGDDDSIEQVREAIRLLKQQGASTGRNVGMHVHLDATTFRRGQLKAMAANMRALERLYASFVPTYRLEGGNADPSDDGEASWIGERGWDSIENWIETVNVANRERTRSNRMEACPVYGRTKTFNFNSLLTYGSVECRLLGHTLNTIKVRAWVRALQTMMSASRRRRIVPPGVDGLEWLVEMGLEQEHADLFRSVADQRGKADWLAVAA